MLITTAPNTTATGPISDKWGDALRGGFVVVPAILIRNQRNLELESGEMLLLINLLLHWWKADSMPFPQTSTLARRMGMSRRSVQRLLRNLERKGLIRRVWGAQPTRGDRLKGASYDLTGLLEVLKRLGAAYVPLGSEARRLARAQGTF